MTPTSRVGQLGTMSALPLQASDIVVRIVEDISNLILFSFFEIESM
jgi:hypothetical protein